MNKAISYAVAHAAVILLAGLVESAWLSRLAIRGAAPDIILLWTVALGLTRGAEVAAIAGAAAGWFQDLLGGLSLGLHALVKLLIGFTSGLGRRTLSLDGFVVPFLVGAGASVASDLLFQAVAAITGTASRDGTDWIPRMAISACYNGLISPVVFALFLRLERRLERIGSDE